jgi:hypothetical protein
MSYYEGDRILAQWEGGEFWFPGRVHSVGGDGSVAVSYDDGMSDIRPANQVKPFDWTEGSAIDAIWSGNGHWYAAHITQLDPDSNSVGVRFDDDGIEETRGTGQCRSR